MSRGPGRHLPAIILVLALAAALGGWALQRAQQQPASVAPTMDSTPQAPVFTAGAMRPDPALVDLAGQPATLDAWRGRWLLVNFWAPWCPPCRAELPELDAAQQHYGARGLQVIGIAEDTPQAVRAYLAHSPLHYPVLLPGDDHPGLAFGNRRQDLPYSVLVDPQGHMVKRHYGAFSQQELEAWLPRSLQ